MKKRTGFIPARLLSEQSGQALILVLIFLLLGSLTLIPVLDQIGTSLKTGVKYEDKTKALYAADAGIEDGIWRIKYEGLEPLFDEDSYNYDFSTNASYDLAGPVNGLTTNVTIENVWIPSNATLGSFSLSADQAMTMIESGKLAVSDTAGAVPGQPYHIKIDFVPAATDNLTIKSVGVWLPQGFTYVTGSSSLEQASIFADCHPDSVSVSDHCGGQAIVWSYNPPDYPLFTLFPNFVSDNGTLTSTISFNYTPPSTDPTKMPAGIAWVTTQMTDAFGVQKSNDVPISWDVDTRIYKITSIAGGTKVEAYTSKLELRDLNNAVAGDYVAIGNSLMTDDVAEWDSSTRTWVNHVKDTWHASSDTTLSSIPADADVLAAYLYWSGFRNDNQVFSDACTSTNLTNSWTNGGDWAYYSNTYRGQHTGADSRRYLTMSHSIDSPSGTAYEISWDQSVASLTDILSDGCSSLTNWTVGSPTAWGVHSNSFRGQYSSVGDAARTLTLTNSANLNGYAAATVSWDQWRGSTALGSGDHLYFNIYNGTSWSGNYTVASSANLTTTQTTFTFAVPTGYFSSGFKIRFYLDGFGSGKYCYLDNITITPQYSASDGLDFAYYDGSAWSSNIIAGTSANLTSSPTTLKYVISSGIITNNFKMRFYLVGMSGAGQYCNIDNIKIIVRAPDTSITFSINDQRVYLDANGDPQAGAQLLTASDSSVMLNPGYGFSYACHQDVSKLVKKYPVVAEEQHHTGNSKYTVGDVQADPGEQVSYAGWSLIVIYFSPATAWRAGTLPTSLSRNR
jgi:Tfp pilus assembly protein PilX